MVRRPARRPMNRRRSNERRAKILRKGARRPHCLARRVAHLSQGIVQLSHFIVEEPILRYVVRGIQLDRRVPDGPFGTGMAHGAC